MLCGWTGLDLPTLTDLKGSLIEKIQKSTEIQPSSYIIIIGPSAQGLGGTPLLR